MTRRGHAVPRPTRRGVGVVAVVVALVAVSIGTGTAELVPLTVAAGLPVLVAPVAAAVRARRARLGLAVDCSADPGLNVVGSEVTLRITVTNRSEGRGPALSIEAPGGRWLRPGDGSGSDPGLGPPMLVPSGLITLSAPGPRARTVFAGAVPSGRRGRTLLPARTSWVLDPFGLFGARGPVLPAASALFYPAADTDVRWRPADGIEGQTGTEATLPAPGRDGPGELIGIRPYVPGDRLSLLHWPARARYRAWFVRQFGTVQGPRTRLVLDDRAGVHRQADFEEMLSHAHGLVERCFEEGRTVELCTLSGRSATLAPVASGVEEGRVLLATVLPRSSRAELDVGGGTVITTGTGTRSLPDGVDRIVVAG